MSVQDLLLGFVGDLLVDREHPAEPFQDVKALLDAPDILFGNLEGPYTDHPHPAPSLGIPVIPPRHNVQAFGPAGFDVLSCANNHIVDAGHEAMLETLADVQGQGIATCGAGAELSAARKPALLTRQGVRAAYLAYASVFPMGYEARSGVPGLAPLRAYNHFFEAYANYHIPGTPGRVETLPDATDMENLRADLAAARTQADIVIASFHWGDFLQRFHLTDHEKRTARFCIGHGADIVVGHHHHMLRGMEWVSGKPVFYGLGHFVFDLRLNMTAEVAAQLARLATPDSYAIGPREGWPLMPMHPDARMTLLGWTRSQRNRVAEMGFVPCRLRADGRVQAVAPDSEEGREVVAYLEQCQTTQKLNGRIEGGGPTIGGFASLRVTPIA